MKQRSGEKLKSNLMWMTLTWSSSRYPVLLEGMIVPNPPVRSYMGMFSQPPGHLKVQMLR
jgi:hypothetical protein